MASPASLPFFWETAKAGGGAGQSAIPRGIAADPRDGRVFLSDQTNRRVDEFSAWGDFIKAWGWDVTGSGPGNTGTGFENCIGARGDSCKAGLSGAGSGQLSTAEGIAVDSSGEVFVVDFSNHRVQKFDPTAGLGEEEAEFELTFGGKVNKTKVEIAAPEAEQNLCTAASGNECQVGTVGTGQGQFGTWEVGSFIAIDTKNTPSDADDVVYVGDQFRIQRFDTGGHYLGDLPDPGGLLAGKTVQSLAADPATGNLYAAFANKENVLELASSGKETCTLKVARPSAIANDINGGAWVVSAHVSGTPTIPLEVIHFGSESPCAETERFNAEEEGIKESTGIATNRCAGSKAPGSLYLSNVSTTAARLRAYGTPPIGCEPPPQKPPEIQAQYAVSVDTDSALLRAGINPNFIEGTTYYVEYGTGRCSAGECDKRAPLGAALHLGGGITNEAVTTAGVALNGLSPGATYHYRFVAQSSGGDPVYGIDPDGKEGEEKASFEAGLEVSFATWPPPLPLKGDCPNQTFRIAASAPLSDCRAFEMVSPVDKNGAGIETAWTGGNPLAHSALDQSAGSGGALTYSSKQSFGDSVSSPYSSQYLSRRDPSLGWTTHSTNAPREGFPGLERQGLDVEYKAFSEDLSQGWLIHEGEPPLAPCAPPNSPDLYRRDNSSGSYEALHCKPNKPKNAQNTIELQGISADGCRAVFRANSALTSDAEETGLYQIYESSCEGPLRLVSLRPSGKACTQDSSVGFSPAGLTGGGDGRTRSVLGAFSGDAKRLYWSCGEALFLRSDPDPVAEGDETVVKASPEECSGKICEMLPTHFQAASADGSRALLEAGGKFWSFDAETAGFGEIAAGMVGNVLGASADATRAYFASTEVLGEAAGKAKKGAPNLYFYEAGASFRFLGTLGISDVPKITAKELSPIHLFPYRRAARVSPDGLHTAFISYAPLTGYDNADAVNGKADEEVFLYDASANEGKGKLVCVSCNPSGARPHGANINAESDEALQQWAAAWIPGWQNELYPGRPLSEDGRRLFFDSVDPLVNRDTNGKEDVYEWEQASGKAQCEEKGAELYVASSGGCLSLISSGQDGQDSEFVDADREGKNVFIRTDESLLPQDPGLLDIYDAREGGGFPAPGGIQPECEGEACQSPAAGPVPSTPSSSVFTGPGNEKAANNPRHPCPKGKQKVKRGGKTSCVKKHKNKRHKGKANANRRAGR